MLRVVLILLCGLIYGCAEKPAHSVLSPLEQQFQTALDNIYAAHPNAVGMLVHVEAPNHNISWSGASGFANMDKTQTLRTDQPALLASNAKTYVAAATLRLIESGKLKLDTPIGSRLGKTSRDDLTGGGYDLETITVLHLLNHTSGIFDYNAAEGLFDFLRENPDHVWTREEQIHRAVTLGKPLGKAGEIFSYADTNYVLLGEIIEQVTGETFFTSVRNLIDYQKQGMDDTWWINLETKPKHTKPLANQYATQLGLASATIHPSFDLFGGGGIASTTKDLGIFTQNLFTGKVYDISVTLDIMTTPAAPMQAMQGVYMAGLSSIDVNGFKGIGHGGFWGTSANYFPALNASIVVFVLERDERALRANVNQAMVKILSAENDTTGDKP